MLFSSIKNISKNDIKNHDFDFAAYFDGESVCSYGGLDAINGFVNEIGGNYDNLFFQSGGKYSLHQIVKLIVDKVGPAKLYITTWGLSEDPVRMLFNLKEQGKLTELYGLFSERVKERQPKAFQMAESIFDKITLRKLHAKVVVVVGKEHSFSVISSMNLTRNPRAETGVITNSKNIADAYSQWIRIGING